MLKYGSFNILEICCKTLKLYPNLCSSLEAKQLCVASKNREGVVGDGKGSE